MLVIHGTTYYPHTYMLDQVLTRFETQLVMLETEPRAHDSLDVWLLTIGLAASTGTEHYHRLVGRVRAVSASLHLDWWNEVAAHIRSVLWLETLQAEQLFRSQLDKVRC